MSQRQLGRIGSVLAAALLACQSPGVDALTPSHRAALRDTVLTIFDSLSSIHAGHPDTLVLRRLHPPTDTLLFIEGGRVEQLTGDSLFRRVLALHVPVHQMDQRFTERRAQLLDRNTAVLTAVETVQWADTAGSHDWHGLLTLVVSRRLDHRAGRGTHSPLPHPADQARLRFSKRREGPIVA